MDLALRLIFFVELKKFFMKVLKIMLNYQGIFLTGMGEK
jgi:hypothetical protein